MSTKNVAFGIWTIVCIIGLTLGIYFITKTAIDVGSTIDLSTNSDEYLVIDTVGEVNFEAVSKEFFLFRKLSGETIVAAPAQPPLGWENKTYFFAGPTNIQGGQWLIENNGSNISVRMVGENITVKSVIENKASAILGVFVLMLLIWCLGLLLYRIFTI